MELLGKNEGDETSDDEHSLFSEVVCVRFCVVIMVKKGGAFLL